MIDKESTTETAPEEVEESDSENQATSDNEKDNKTWEEKYNDTYDALLRAKAEVENIKKRSEKEVSNAYKFSTESVFLDLIPIFESLDIAVSQDTDSLSKENLIDARAKNASSTWRESLSRQDSNVSSLRKGSSEAK